MTETTTRHRLDGLEPDNLLAFLALLGLMRSLQANDRGLPETDRLYPRACWELDAPPLRPALSIRRPVSREEVVEIAARGLLALAANHDFGERNQNDLNYPRNEARAMLEEAARSATASIRGHVDLLAALMSDAVIKKKKDKEGVEPTPLCLLFGQGHQHFLERLIQVPSELAPPQRGRGNVATTLSAPQCLFEALFMPWHREDPTFSFRWDPEEDVRYALMAGNPTDPAFKCGTQHGANRLAAVGLAVLTLAPETRAGRVRPSVLGGSLSSEGFSVSWPIWREPATLAGIRALLGHPELRKVGGLAQFGVDHVLNAKRISVGKFMNFTRARVRLPA